MICSDTGRPLYRRHSLALGAGLLVIGATRAGAAADRLPTRAPGVLKIGTYFVNPPFEYLDKGQETGFDIDLMNEIARRMKLRASYVNTQWEVILQQMQEGLYDCIIGGITITPARQQVLRWSIPYLITTLSLVVNGTRTPEIRTIKDLKAASVGVQAATTDYDAALAMRRRGEIGSVKVYPFDRIADAMTDLEAGRITAVMKVRPVAEWLAARQPGLRILAQVPHDPQPLGIGFRMSNAALAESMNLALKGIQRDGTYARLTRGWGL